MPIVAAVDTTDRAPAVVDQARELADLYGVDLHVVHVEEFSVGNLQTGSTDDRDVDDARREAREIAAEVASRAGLDEGFEPVGLVGEPAARILEYSEEHDPEYIVVSGRKKSPIGKALFGSVTQSLLLDAETPVVAVMDEGE